MDHSQAIEKEKEFARRWMRKHGGELPSMDQGKRINGDPLIYEDLPHERQLMALLQPSENPSAPYRELPSVTAPLILAARLTPRQAIVLLAQMLGASQDRIATELGITQQAVSSYVAAARKKLNNTTATPNP